MKLFYAIQAVVVTYPVGWLVEYCISPHCGELAAISVVGGYIVFAILKEKE